MQGSVRPPDPSAGEDDPLRHPAEYSLRMPKGYVS